MAKKRPINLNLFTISFPIPAIASILHRISGVILFLVIPLMIWALHLSLNSQQDFDSLVQFITTPCMKFIFWCILSAFIYHFIAGIRHLLMDMGVAEEIKSGKWSAWITIILSVILAVLAGIWLW